MDFFDNVQTDSKTLKKINDFGNPGGVLELAVDILEEVERNELKSPGSIFTGRSMEGKEASKSRRNMEWAENKSLLSSGGAPEKFPSEISPSQGVPGRALASI